MKKLYGVATLTVALIATTLLLGRSHKVAAAQSAQDHVAADFAADVSSAESHYIAISQVPISTDSFTRKVTSPAWKTKPTWYMVATQDRSINPDQERMMEKRGNGKTVEVNASHVAYMSHPKGNGQAHRRGCYLRTRQLVAKKFCK